MLSCQFTHAFEITVNGSYAAAVVINRFHDHGGGLCGLALQQRLEERQVIPGQHRDVIRGLRNPTGVLLPEQGDDRGPDWSGEVQWLKPSGSFTPW